MRVSVLRGRSSKRSDNGPADCLRPSSQLEEIVVLAGDPPVDGFPVEFFVGSCDKSYGCVASDARAVGGLFEPIHYEVGQGDDRHNNALGESNFRHLFGIERGVLGIQQLTEGADGFRGFLRVRPIRV